jgi:hypothetical protein
MPELRGIQTKPFSTLIVALGFCFIMASCNGPKTDGAVVVRVFRDSGSDFSRDLDNRLYSFNNFKQERHVKSGKLVFVATMEGNYKDLLGKIALIKPQMIILDSSADAQLLSGMQVDLTKQGTPVERTGIAPRSFLLGSRVRNSKRLIFFSMRLPDHSTVPKRRLTRRYPLVRLP